MKKIKILFSIILFWCLISSVQAQTETTLSFMDDLYQSTYYSPFNKSDFNVSIGLPVLSSVYLGGVNSGFTLADIYQNDPSKKIDPNNVISKWKKTEYVALRSQIDLFHIFIQEGSNGFSFNITENFSTQFTYASDAARLAWKGNDQFKGGQADLSGFGLEFMHYREYALGYYKTMDKWQFGGKAKLLFGKYTVSTEKSDLTIDVDDVIYGSTANGSFKINTGGYDFDALENDPEGNAIEYMRNTKNKGLALDLGASYQYNEKLQLNAALTNLGFIKWNDSPNSISYDESVAFAGVDFFKVLYENDIDSLDEGFEKYFEEQFPDSAKVDSSTNSFSTSIPMNFSLGARYELYENTYAVGRINFNGYKGLHTAVTVGVYHDFFRWFNIGLTNTTAYGKLINPGLGLVLKGGPVQFYLATDNLLAARFTRIKQANARFGLNLVFGNMKDQEKISSVIE